MKTLFQNALKPLFALAVIASALTLSSCNKDEACGVRVNVLDSTGARQQYMWVKIDWALSVPPSGQKSPVYPIQLNTRKDGFVECTIPLPGIPYAYVYDSANYQLSGIALKAAPIKLIPGETVTVDIAIN